MSSIDFPRLKKAYFDDLTAPPGSASWRFLSRPQQTILDRGLAKPEETVRYIWKNKGLGDTPPKSLVELVERVQEIVGLIASEHRTAWENVLPGILSVRAEDYEVWEAHQAAYRKWLWHTLLVVAAHIFAEVGGKSDDRSEIRLILKALAPRSLRPFEDTITLGRDPWQVEFVEPVAKQLAAKSQTAPTQPAAGNKPTQGGHPATTEKADDDGGPYYPARYFEQFNISGEQLRRAVAAPDGRLRHRKVNGRLNHYSEPDARKLWPDRFVEPPK